MKVVYSVIIPVRSRFKKLNKKLVLALKKQGFKNFEVIVANKPAGAGPALKRDFAAKKSKGKILAFLDDDAYPAKDWLKNALPYFENQSIAAVCGPGITPPNSNFKEKISGYILTSAIGAGGAGTYRNRPEKKREVDDYPSFNLLVRKTDFWQVGGFNTSFWPGEDTKLCHDLVYKLKKKIIYDPKILVYHHRRQIFLPHLKQIARFGIHRGYFVHLYPKTSLRIGYFLPSFFIGLLCFLLFISAFYQIFFKIFLLIIAIYFMLIFLTSFKIYLKERKIAYFYLSSLAIFLTHWVYGINFIRGLSSRKI